MNFSIFNSRGSQRYLLWALLPCGCLLIGVGLFNWSVNPLLLFKSPDIAGTNVHKPLYLDAQHEVKPYLLREFRPDQLILGSSRAGNGLDPAHAAFTGGVAFNYSIPGARIQTIADLFNDASSVAEIDTVILTLDFFAFNAVPSDVDLRDAVLRTHLNLNASNEFIQSSGIRLLNRRLEALFSWAVLQASYETISLQSRVDEGLASQFLLDRNGHWKQLLPASRVQLDQIRETERRYMSYTWFPPPTRRFELSYGELSSFETFETLVTQLYNKVDSVILVISPLHSRFQSALGLVQLDEKFEGWKRQLVSVNEAVANSLGREAFPLWDFADFSEPNREAIPASNNSVSRMRYYVDGQHYTSELGDKLLDRVFDLSAEQDNSFGSLLTSDNVEDHLRLLRARQQQYARTNSADMDDLRQSYSAIQ